ncbi:MAG: VOC family protein [Myxococcales bacterium]|nr:VOC family protein [Myxococcales bacterium]
MIDHLTLLVSDYAASKAFYLAVLERLGYGIAKVVSRAEVPHMPFDEVCGFGAGAKPTLWLRPSATVQPTHVAIVAKDRAAVRAFHAAAVAAGARDNGAPGPRPEYHPGYYGAFVLDPDGYNLEAACHRPE